MKGRWVLAAGLAGLVGLCGAATAGAQGKSKEKGKQQEARYEKTTGDKVREVLPASEPVFTTAERTMIKQWFGDHRKGLPPGLAKREKLPPGLEKQLRERGTLPPGLEKKLQPLPYELERELRPVPTGYRRVVIAGNVILMEPKTAVIYDIIRDVIP